VKMKDRKAEELVRDPYPMRVFQDPDSANWVADVIDLPGCVGVAKTPQEAVKVAEAFIRDWINEAVAQGWDVPEPSTRSEASGRFVVRLPRSLHARLQESAEIEGTSLNQLVVAMLSERVVARELLSRVDSALEGLKHAEVGCPLLSAWPELGAALGFARSGSLTMDWTPEPIPQIATQWSPLLTQHSTASTGRGRRRPASTRRDSN
jgi:antitoxin HicB